MPQYLIYIIFQFFRFYFEGEGRGKRITENEDPSRKIKTTKRNVREYIYSQDTKRVYFLLSRNKLINNKETTETDTETTTETTNKVDFDGPSK